MRVGVDIDKALADRDGIGSYCRHLVNALGREEWRGELFLYALRRPDADVDVFQAAFDPLPCKVVPRPGSDPRADDLDLFHATAWRAPIGWNGRLAMTAYDLTFLTFPDCHTTQNRMHCTSGLLRGQLANADFLAISAATGEEVRRLVGVDSDRLHVVHLAAAERFIPGDDLAAGQEVDHRFGLEPGYVLAVGTIEPRKNHGRLLDAWLALPEALRRRHPLVVAGGTGWHSADLRARLEAAAGVAVLGEVDDDALLSLYRAAALFAYPSLAEGFGLPVLEAMACGTPTLISETPALVEVAGGAARAVDPMAVETLSAALADLLGDEAARADLADRGLRRAANFSWAATARGTLQVYRRILGR